MSFAEEVKLISEMMWKFHNDRLSDPSVKEMKPYIQPILDLHQKEVERMEEYGRLHQVIEMFQSGVLSADTYTEYHAEITKRLTKLTTEEK